MFQADLFASRPATRLADSSTRPAETGPLTLPNILERLATVSERPRHAFMVLNLIAQVSSASGKAGPYVRLDGRAMLIRDWLCDALAPMAHRDPRRIARAVAVRAELEAAGTLPEEEEAANLAIDEEVKGRVRRTGLTHISRAVSDLVKAGLISRHYEGYWIDHHNKGGGRHPVFTLLPATKRALAISSTGAV